MYETVYNASRVLRILELETRTFVSSAISPARVLTVVPCELVPRRDTVAPPLTNLLIESLPPAEKAHLLELVEPVPLPLRAELFGVGETPRYVHFLTSGLASAVIETAGGEGLEVGLAGREDLPESLFLLGPQTGQIRCFMQIEGTALRMSFHRFEQIFERNEAV